MALPRIFQKARGGGTEGNAPRAPCRNPSGAAARHAELAPQNLGGQGVQEAERGPPTQPLLTPSAPQIKFLNH